jgi:hypothetical protein
MKCLLIIFISSSLFAGPGLFAEPPQLFTMGVMTELGWASGAFGSYEAEGTVSGWTGYEDLDNWYAKLGARLWIIELFYIGGSVNTITNSETGNWTFSPFFTNYRFDLGIKWMGFELFYEHHCSHPVTPYSYQYRVGEVSGEGSIDKIGLRYEHKYYTVKAN